MFLYLISLRHLVPPKHYFNLPTMWFSMKIFNKSSVVYSLKETVYNLFGDYYADEKKMS